MTRTEIECMARSAGLFVPIKGIPENGALIRFFHAAYATGATAEREACAKVCDEFESEADPDAGFVLAAAIRANGAGMTTFREAATQALEALEGGADSWQLVGPAIDALKEALVEDAMQKFTDVNQELEAALAEPVQEPGDFDHGIGADRFKVVRGAFWWHVLIGDSPTKHGKFHSRASAEKMAADLLREFRNGAFVQHETALAEPPVDDPHRDHWVAIAEAAQKIAASTECGLAEAKALCAALDRLTDAALAEPVAWRYQDARGNYRYRGYVQGFDKEYSLLKPVPLYTAPPQRQAEPVQESAICDECGKSKHDGWALYCVKCVEPMFAPPQRKPLTETSAERTLKRLGYTDCGGEFWKPPLGAPAEPVQEPVAWIDDSGHPKHLSHLQSATERRLYGPLRPLYTTPPPAEPAQEQPVCDECGKHKRDGWALYCVKCVEPMFSPPQRPAESVQEPQCNPHPKAPHGFLRNASHNENRYVCECEGWEPYEAGYQAGMEAALRAQS